MYQQGRIDSLANKTLISRRMSQKDLKGEKWTPALTTLRTPSLLPNNLTFGMNRVLSTVAGWPDSL